MDNKKPSESILTITYEDRLGGKATKKLLFTKEATDLGIIHEAFTAFYTLMSIEVGLETKLLDSYFNEIVADDDLVIDIIPEFKDLDTFTNRILSDESFKNFMFDFYKKTFCEE